MKRICIIVLVFNATILYAPKRLKKQKSVTATCEALRRRITQREEKDVMKLLGQIASEVSQLPPGSQKKRWKLTAEYAALRGKVSSKGMERLDASILQRAQPDDGKHESSSQQPHGLRLTLR